LVLLILFFLSLASAKQIIGLFLNNNNNNNNNSILFVERSLWQLLSNISHTVQDEMICMLFVYWFVYLFLIGWLVG
jgi:hypothetical protein